MELDSSFIVINDCFLSKLTKKIFDLNLSHVKNRCATNLWTTFIMATLDKIGDFY